eukprot:688435-Alexandrium_andersonii.AAC.1
MRTARAQPLLPRVNGPCDDFAFVRMGLGASGPRSCNLQAFLFACGVRPGDRLCRWGPARDPVLGRMLQEQGPVKPEHVFH